MRADRHDDRHAALLEQLTEERALPDVMADQRLVGRLADALRERFHVVTGEAAVVREAFVDDDQLARALCKRVVVQTEQSPDRDEVVLLRGEDRAVGERRDLADESRAAAAARAPARGP